MANGHKEGEGEMKGSKTRFTPKTGWIYVVTNDCLKPVKVKAGSHMGEEVPAVKIGNAKEFINRLGSLNTAVYENFTFHMGIKMNNVRGLEKIIHTALQDYQIKTCDGEITEFFACPLKDVVSRIKKLLAGGHIDFEEYKGAKVIGRSSSGIRSNIKKQEKVMRADSGRATMRAAASTFSVRFPDGAVIADRKACNVLGLAVEKFGARKVAELGISCGGEPLVTNDRSLYKKHPTAVVAISGGWFVKTHSGTKAKIGYVKRIAKALKVRVTVKNA